MTSPRGRPIFVAAVFAATLIVAACAPAPPPEPEIDLSAELAGLADDVWQYSVSRNPYLKVRSGELMRELPDFTEEWATEGVDFSQSVLRRLDALPMEELSHDDAITAAMLRWDSQMTVDLQPFYWQSFPYTPYLLGQGLSFIHGQMAAHPFTDAKAHTDNYLVILDEYAEAMEQLGDFVQGQMERSIFLSRHALPGVVDLIRSFQSSFPQLAQIPDDRLGGLPRDQREDFQTQVSRVIQGRILPAYDRLLELFQSESYEVHAPDAVGLSQYPNGESYYRALVKLHTTLEITPEELHELGKEHVARLEAEMEAIRADLGWTGTRQEFHQRLLTDPHLLARSAEDLEAAFNAYIAAMEPEIPELFRTAPKAPYGVKRLDPAAEATMTYGFYMPPTPNEPVGRYHYNGSNLGQRPMVWAGPLIYHELIPGHHFHLALQAENLDLPMFRRQYITSTAFNEGWANYAAFLAAEMGLLDDPYDRYGLALFDMFISLRLVLDTGMNLLGWTLEEGRDYMLQHAFLSQSEVATETLRYSTDLLAQALAYKSGVEKLLELREEARDLAGESFDIRDFHDAVLGSGAMPLSILQDHIQWTFSQRSPDNQEPSE